MKLKFDKNKYLLFVIASWLIAKLRWTFEMSRLTFFRASRNEEIRFVIQQTRKPPVSYWNLDNDRLTILNYDIKDNVIVLHKLPELSKN